MQCSNFLYGSQSLEATEIITEIVILNNNYISLWLCKHYLDSGPTVSLPPPSPTEVRAISSTCPKESPCLNSKAQEGNTSKKIIVISFPVRHDQSLYPILQGPGAEHWNSVAQKQGIGRNGMPKEWEKKRVQDGVLFPVKQM